MVSRTRAVTSSEIELSATKAFTTMHGIAPLNVEIGKAALPALSR
jgi:hypothetical protein